MLGFKLSFGVEYYRRQYSTWHIFVLRLEAKDFNEQDIRSSPFQRYRDPARLSARTCAVDGLEWYPKVRSLRTLALQVGCAPQYVLSLLISMRSQMFPRLVYRESHLENRWTYWSFCSSLVTTCACWTRFPTTWTCSDMCWASESIETPEHVRLTGMEWGAWLTGEKRSKGNNMYQSTIALNSGLHIL